MSQKSIIAIGASAGGVTALSSLFSNLPSPNTAAFFVTLHVSSRCPSVLPQILSGVSHLPAHHPSDRTRIQPGHIYVAPPDHHLLVEKTHMRVEHGPRENLQRPAIDPMFRSAAHAHGKWVAGIVLTGMLDDGASGLAEIQNCGGIAIVQDPAEAAFPDMPRNALASVKPDFRGRIADIRELLVSISRSKTANRLSELKTTPTINGKCNAEWVRPDGMLPSLAALGPPSPFVCPECKGPLWEVGSGRIPRYQCIVGHAYSGKTLMSANEAEVEKALWMVLQILEQRIELRKRLQRIIPAASLDVRRQSLMDKTRKSEAQVKLLRELLEN